MLPPAARLILDPRHFTTGALARDKQGRSCGTLPGSGAVSFCALGAILWAYRDTDIENRHAAAKRAFDTCKARYDHTMLGQLQHEQAFSLLADSGV